MTRPRSADLRTAVYGVTAQAAALAILEKRRRARRTATPHMEHADGGLQAFIPRISRRFQSPKHLEAFTRELERAFDFGTRRSATEKGAPRIVISVPPRHGKTECVLHFFAWALSKDPSLELAFLTYAASLAESKSWRARALAKLAGVRLSRDMATKREWRTTDGGGLIACGIDGGITGQGFNVLVVDDPHKNFMEAQSKIRRDRVEDFLDNDAMSRLHPGGAIVIIHTRWHEDDLAGRLKKKGWQVINLQAVAEEADPLTGRTAGEALWPERYPADCQLFEEQKKKPHTWASLYQGRPRPRGTGVFREATFYAGEIPTKGRRAIGVDLAYSVKTSADWSVAVVLFRHVPEVPSDDDFDDDGERRKRTSKKIAPPVFYVLEVLREQEDSRAFEARLANLRRRHPSARGLFLGSSIECEVAKNMQGRGLTWLAAELARGDKFTRAEDVAVAWNEGRVLLPEDEEAHPWVADFLEELWKFTGNNDEHDDQVDALANAHRCAEAPTFALR